MLTDTLIKPTKITPKGQTKSIADSGGLSLYATHTSKYWRLRYYFDSKQQVMSLGEYPTVPLLEARQKQMEIKKLLNSDKHPIVEKKRVSKWTFEKVAQLWLSHWQVDKSEKHAGTTKRRLDKDILPKIGKLPIKPLV